MVSCDTRSLKNLLTLKLNIRRILIILNGCESFWGHKMKLTYLASNNWFGRWKIRQRVALVWIKKLSEWRLQAVSSSILQVWSFLFYTVLRICPKSDQEKSTLNLHRIGNFDDHQNKHGPEPHLLSIVLYTLIIQESNFGVDFKGLTVYF